MRRTRHSDTLACNSRIHAVDPSIHASRCLWDAYHPVNRFLWGVLLVQSVKLNVRAVPEGPLRVLLLQSVKLNVRAVPEGPLRVLLLQSVKLDVRAVPQGPLRVLLLQSVKLDVRTVPQGPLRVLLLQSVKLKDLLALLLQSVKLKDLLQVLFLRHGNLKGYLDMSPVQSKCLPVLDVQYQSHLCVLLRQSLSLLRVLPW